MVKKIGVCFLAGYLSILGGSLGDSLQSRPQLDRANFLYFLDNPTEQQDIEAMELYQQVLSVVPESAEALDYVLAAERLGNLYLSYGKVEDAKKSYNQGILLARAFQLGDTTVYAHHLYLGETYFSLSQLDSSLFHLKQAELLQSQLNSNAEPERLFNALGVYHYETGNFNQSVSYFTKAESFLSADNSDWENYARYSFSSNKASALYRIEQFDQAQQIYRELLKLGINTDQLRINLANTYIEQGLSEGALAILDSIDSNFASGSLSYQNLRSKVFLQQGDLEKLEKQLSIAQKLVSADTGPGKNLQKGIYFILRGDLEMRKNKYESALNYFHSAIVQLHSDVKLNDPFSNPQQMTLGMGALTLFEALTKKAKAAWAMDENKEKNPGVELGIQTWEKAFSLSKFISLNYDNEEARIFLGDKVQVAYQEAIDGLFHLTSAIGEDRAMKKAFQWAEESKSEGLKIGAMEEAKKRSLGMPENLIQEEKNILFSISKNYQKQLDNRNPELQNQLDKELLDLNVELSRLREKFRAFPGFISFEEQSFELEKLQKSLPAEYGILSLFNSRENLFLFWLDRKNLSWNIIPQQDLDWEGIMGWAESIKSPRISGRYTADRVILGFSKQLLNPFQSRLDAVDELLIIPHGSFHSFPFELLPQDSHTFLLEAKAISYQFSARFVGFTKRSKDQDLMLSFAPFAGIETDNPSEFSPLPGSEAEIQKLPQGLRLVGKEGKKQVFLAKAPGYQMIHLATHAVASSQDPKEAFIAFYPEGEEYRLFAQELATQHLESVELVYLSACETGGGKQSASEGLISLARSFAIAGVDQLVLSEWVSEDQVSQYLAYRFYHHVERGETYANSLRLAKLDFLEDPTMAQFHHPFFWTTYRIIGQPEDSKGRQPLFFGLAAILFLTILGSWVVFRLRGQIVLEKDR